MRHAIARAALLAVLLAALGPAARAADAAVGLGVDGLLAERIELLAGKRVGLLTHAAAVDGALVPTVDRLARDGRFQLVQLWAPEHGLRGAVRAGRPIPDEVDPATGLPVEALFGARRAPSPESLARVDVLVCDLQDVGSRTYTFTTTMARALQAAARAGKPFVVLDRPNPLGGLLFEGPVREERHRSGIGWGPLPVSHGLTIGELARFYDDALGLGATLHVVPLKGWRRAQVWEDTGLTWVPTSAGIPHALHAHLYIATGMVGGATRNVNEGVGTTQPFELIGAAFTDGRRLAAALNALALPGVRFRPHAYTPYYGRFRGRTLDGVQLLLEDPRAFRPLHTALSILVTLERLWPGRVRFKDDPAFGRVWGTTEVKRAVRRGESVEAIEAAWEPALAEFARRRARHLLYP